MLRHVVGLVGICLLAGCSGGSGFSLSKLNPFTWGSGSETTEAQVAAARQQLAVVDDGRVALATVTALAVEPNPTGVIIRANGIAPGAGYHSAALRPIGGGRPDADGTIRFMLVARPPEGNGGTLPGQSMSAAAFLGKGRIAGASRVMVSAGDGAQTVPLR